MQPQEGLCLFGAAVEQQKEETMDTKKIIIDGTFNVLVDYNQSIEEAVKSYDSVTPQIISERFIPPLVRRGKSGIVVELVRFEEPLSTEEMIHEFKRMGYRPANIYELLALGEQFPEVQKKFTIVAFGSLWQFEGGDHYIYYAPFLYGTNLIRGLRLGRVDANNFWLGFCRFAVVRNE